MKKLLAFTLAETLIVIGIIGVVSALALPNLNSSTGEKEKVAKLKKVYQNLNDAYARAQAVYGPVDEWFQVTVNVMETGDYEVYNNIFGERLTEFLKTSKICRVYDGSCAPRNVGFMFDHDYGLAFDSSSYSFILADGTYVTVGDMSNGKICNLKQSDTITDVCSTDVDVSDTIHSMLVDIDGKKGANMLGIDVFPFVIAKSGIYPVFNDETDTVYKTEGGMQSCYKNGVCTGWVINNGNMDYLKVDSNGKCPNGTVLSWTNTSCK